MVKHLFKLIWNKKKQNFLLMVEILISFIVLFAVFTLSVYYYQNYNRPRGFEYENVWSLGFGTPDGMSNADSIATFRQTLKQMVKSMPQVEDVSFSDSNIPFGNSNIGTSLNYNKTGWQTERYTADDDYQKVLKVHIIEGRWFSKIDEVAKEKPIIINETLKKKVFGGQSAVGKIMSDGAFNDGNMKIVGVIEDTKDKGDYSGAQNGYFRRLDTSNTDGGGMMLIKVKANADAAFESRLYKALSNALSNTSVDIRHMDKERDTKNMQFLGPVIIVMIIAGFLIINVALGLFGVLWYNINKRKSEIGLRRAIGASGAGISKQLVGEALVLSTISLIVGCFFAVQFPLLNLFDLPTDTYVFAILFSILFIYFLVLLCSFYPGRQAAAIYPAEALHED